MSHRALFAARFGLKQTYVRPFRILALLSAVFLLLGADSPQTPDSAIAHGPAEALYLQLQSVGLDKTKVFKIREASLDRAKLHISLDDGTIAFTEAVDGHITGAFFQGDGEVLLMPPTRAEQASLSLFTGAAILEETFSSAYLRFNDDVFAELQPQLRPADDPDAFASEYDSTVRNLAASDALRLLLTFSDSLPTAQKPAPEKTSAENAVAERAQTRPPDHMLHGYLQGNKLGAFDVRYDSLFVEQIDAGQSKHLNGEDYYDIWTSFSVPAPGSSAVGSPLSESDVQPADYSVTSFRIQANVKPVKELEAEAVLSLTARQRTRRMLLFELSRMLTVEEVRADGRSVEFIHNQAIEGSHLAKKGNDVVAVILPASLEPGQKIQLTFKYSGSVLSEAANGLLYVGDRGTWYPNLGFERALFNLEFHYPDGWTLVATGHRTSTKQAGNEQISNWVTERPVPVAGFNLGKYSQSVSHAGKVVVTTFATPNVERSFPSAAMASSDPPVLPNSPQRLDPARAPQLPIAPVRLRPSPSGNEQMVGNISAKAIEFYSRYFGPYPYGELSITQMPGETSQGWPGLIFLSSYSFLTSEEKSHLEPNAVRRVMSEQVIAHETAHQWWGDLINWPNYHDQWIMEALANYSALMLLESHDRAKFEQIMYAYRDDLIAKNAKGVPFMNAGPVTLGFRLSSSQFPGGYEPICYERGTWLLHMLRTMMREPEEHSRRTGLDLETEPFIRALRKLRKDYEDKAVSTAQLMRIFESELPPSLWYEGHKSLDWFSEGWVNGSAVPSFVLRDLKFTDKAKSTEVSGTILQQHAPETLVTAVPIYTLIGGRNIFVKRIFAEGEESQFHISAPPGTRRLNIDPEQTLLSLAK